MILIIGGAGSGKSAFAEDLLIQLAGDQISKVYIATMRPYGEEAAARIQKHQKARSGKGFITMERYVRLAGLTERDFAGGPRGNPGNLNRAVLLECLGNLCANELYDPNGAGDDAEEAIWRGILSLREKSELLVIVSNEIFLGGMDYQGDTARYMRILANLNRKIASLADGVCEIACGTPIWYKYNIK